MDALKLEVLSRIAERTIRRVLEIRYGAIMTDDKKKHGYYNVKWDRPPHILQEDTEIFQAGDAVCNSTYLNPIQQSHHWCTQSTIEIVVRVQHVIAENIDLKNLFVHQTSKNF